MKKIIITLASLLITSGLIAATTGNITLTGVIDPVVSLTVSANGSGNNMDLTATQSDLTVATIGENSNTLNGYKIMVKSLNGGDLTHTNGGTVHYTAKYNGVVVPLAVTDQLAKNVAVGGVQSNSSLFAISYTGQDPTTLEEGTYSDTVTFTIVAL